MAVGTLERSIHGLHQVFLVKVVNSLQAEVSERETETSACREKGNSSYVSPSWVFNYQTSSFRYSLLRTDSLLINFQWDSGR